MIHPNGRGTTIPFVKGDAVMERIGDVRHETTVIEVEGDECLTQTGNLYSRETGMRVPAGEGPYRSLTGTAFGPDKLKARKVVVA